MNIIYEYNILSNISNGSEKIYQPHYKTWNNKINHNKHEIILYYDQKKQLYIPESENELEHDSEFKSKSEKN